MAEIIFRAERQYTFCQFAQRKFVGEKAGILYDKYLVTTNMDSRKYDEETVFVLAAGYFLHLKYMKNPQETCFKIATDSRGNWCISFRWYRKLEIPVPEIEILNEEELKNLFQNYLEKKGSI